MDIERPDLYKKKRRRLWMLSVSSISVLAALGVYVLTLGNPVPRVRKDQIWVGSVKHGDMLRNVRGLGRLVPQDMRWITSRTSGRVEEKLVQSGAAVEPETVILRLSNPELEQQYLNAQLELKAAEAELTSTRVRLQSDLLSMKSAYVQLQEQTEMALLEQEINNQLFADGLVSDLVRKRSELSAHHLQSRVKMEAERLAFQEQSMEPQLATQQTQVDRAKARLDLLGVQVDALVVRAGYRGVVQRLELEQGMQVAEGQEIALVSDPSRLKGVIEIQESQAREISVGQSALVDTRTSGEVAASVARIDPNDEMGFVKVDVVFANGLPDGCRADQTIQGTIELQRLEGVMYVDRPSVVKENTQTSVFVLSADGSRAERVPAEFGRSSVTLIEVISGLKNGDRIVLSDTSKWDNAKAIAIR